MDKKEKNYEDEDTIINVSDGDESHSDSEESVVLSETKNFLNLTKKQQVICAILFLVCLAIYLCVGVHFLIKRDEKKEAELKESIIEQAEEIEDKYGINIMWEGRYSVPRVNELMQKPSLTSNEEKIKFALDEMEPILERFPDGFFNEYKEENIPNLGCDYIDIYLCENDVSDTMTDGVRAASTNFYHKNSGAYVFIDVNQKEILKRGVAHELFHVMDSKIGTVSLYNAGINNDLEDSIDFRWIKCNPDGYEYLKFGDNQDEIHIFDSDLPYDIDTEKIENVYFVNKYAQFTDQEDRAETFSYLLFCDDADDLPESYNSPHVKEKAKLIVDMIDDTFDCVDDNAYWARMYHEKYGD